MDESRSLTAPGSGTGLTVALTLAPVAWFLHLCIGYAISSLACGKTGALVALHIITAFFLAGALFGTWVALQQWRGLKEEAGGAIENVRGRSPFLAVSALLLSALFTAIIVLAWLAFALGGQGCHRLSS